MTKGALQRSVTWEEDRATQRCDPSAEPGVQTEARAVPIASAARSFFPPRDGQQCAKPSRHEAATSPARRLHNSLTNYA